MKPSDLLNEALAKVARQPRQAEPEQYVQTPPVDIVKPGIGTQVKAAIIPNLAASDETDDADDAKGTSRHQGTTTERVYIGRKGHEYIRFVDGAAEYSEQSAFYTFPIILDSAHIGKFDVSKKVPQGKYLGSNFHDHKWYKDNVTDDDTKLTNVLLSSFGYFTKPEVQKYIEKANQSKNKNFTTEINGVQVQFRTTGTKSMLKFIGDESVLEKMKVFIEAQIKQIFGKTILPTKDGAIIQWTKPDRARSNDGFGIALTHNVVMNTKSKQVNYFHGYIHTHINADAVTPEESIAPSGTSKFNLSDMDNAWGFKSASAAAVKNASKLKPSEVLNLSGSIDIIGGTVKGAFFGGGNADATVDAVLANIKQNVAKNKFEGLDKITRALCNGNVPVKMEDTLMKYGFSTNAVGVDYLEVVHPLLCVKNDPKVMGSNGLYMAARTFLGGPGVCDMSKAKVGYFDDATYPLVDSILETEDPKTKKKYQLYISSKGGASGTGAAASVTGVKACLDKLLGYGNTVESLGEQFGINARDARRYQKWIDALAAGKSDEVNFEDVKADERFTKFCLWLISNSNIVQINSDYTEDADYENGEIIGFTATWPNKLFDSIEFLTDKGRFKLKIGHGAGDPLRKNREFLQQDYDANDYYKPDALLSDTQRFSINKLNQQGEDYKMTVSPPGEKSTTLSFNQIFGGSHKWSLAKRIDSVKEAMASNSKLKIAKALEALKLVYEIVDNFQQSKGGDWSNSIKDQMKHVHDVIEYTEGLLK